MIKDIFVSLIVVVSTWFSCYFLDVFYTQEIAPFSDPKMLRTFKKSSSGLPPGTELTKKQKRSIVNAVREDNFRVSKKRYFTARSHNYGIGIKENKMKALSFYKSAASLGHVESHCAISTMYETGDGVDVNLQRAYFWAYMPVARRQPCGKKILSDIKSRMSEEDIRVAKNRASICLNSNYQDCG